MTHPVCIYFDKNLATRAAAFARQAGAVAKVKVESVSNDGQAEALFIIETEKSHRQKVIDAIANAASHHPSLADEAVKCPTCDSIKIEYTDLKDKIASRAIGKSLDYIGEVFGFKKVRKFHCARCGERWQGSSEKLGQ